MIKIYKKTSRNSKIVFLIIGTLVFVSSLIPLTVGIYIYYKTQIFLAESESTQGEVVKLVERNEGFYSPRIFFKDDNGREHTVTVSGGRSPPGYYVGEKVKIFYNPIHPEQFRIATWFGVWGGAVICGVLVVGSWLMATTFMIIGPILFGLKMQSK